MAHYNMAFAPKLIRELREQEPVFYTGLCARLPLEETEREISEKLDLIYLPQPDDRGLIPQFDGYFGLREIDLTPYKDRETVGTIYNDYNAEQINGIMAVSYTHLVEPDTRRCELDRAVEQYGFRKYEDYRQLLEENEIDIALVCCENAYHPVVMETILRRGIHVVVEKPLAATMQGAMRIARAARESRCV